MAKDSVCLSVEVHRHLSARQFTTLHWPSLPVSTEPQCQQEVRSQGLLRTFLSTCTVLSMCVCVCLSTFPGVCQSYSQPSKISFPSLSSQVFCQSIDCLNCYLLPQPAATRISACECFGQIPPHQEAALVLHQFQVRCNKDMYFVYQGGTRQVRTNNQNPL